MDEEKENVIAACSCGYPGLRVVQTRTKLFVQWVIPTVNRVRGLSWISQRKLGILYQGFCRGQNARKKIELQ